MAFASTKKLKGSKWLKFTGQVGSTWHVDFEIVFATPHGIAFAHHNNYRVDPRYSNAVLEIVKDGVLRQIIETEDNINSVQGLHAWAKRIIDRLFAS